MKKTFTLAGLLFASLAILASFGPEDDEKIHVSVIHHEGSKVMVYDTTFAASSGYTVEQFLLDNGLDPATADIVYTDELEGPHTHNLSRDIWYMHGGDSDGLKHCVFTEEIHDSDGEHRVKRIKHEGNGASIGTEVKIFKSVDEDGKMVTKKYVNGEEVPFEEGDNDWTDEDGKVFEGLTDVMFIEEGDAGDGNNVVILKREGEHGEGQPHMIKRVVNGDGAHKSGDGEEIEMNVEVEKIVNAEGEEEVQIWVNGELIDESEHDQYLNHEGGEGEIEIIIIGEGGEEGDAEFIYEIETEDVIILQGDCEGANEFVFDGMSNVGYTIAIVTKGEEAAPAEKNVLHSHELAIDQLRFSPNPNQGMFNLSFDLPEKGRTLIMIFDLQGKVVYEENLGKFSGQYNGNINISNEGPGTYILNIVQGDKKLAEKLIVQ